MIPWKKDITIRRGNTKEMFFRVRTRVWNEVAGAYEDGPYRDLTGYTILCQVRENEDSQTVLLTFAPTIGNQADEVLGRGAVYLKVTDEETATVPPAIKTGVYDVLFTTPDGDSFSYVEGKVTFTKGISRV